MTAPLSRDKQIEMMKAAAERHADYVARWKADAGVRRVMRKLPDSEDGKHAYVRCDVKVARCG
jgi:hypothetical protein